MNGRVCLLLTVLLATACRGPKTASGAGGRTVADHQRTFIDGCNKKTPNAPEYCQCAWDEFANMFTEEEMNATDVPPEKFEQYKKTLLSRCTDKMPEEALKAGYDEGCMSGRTEYASYCDCTYNELRATFSPGEMANPDTLKSARFAEAKKAAVKACSDKIPEAVVQQSFMSGCAKQPALKKFCTCAWVELRKEVSIGEINSGDYDEHTVFPKIEKVCGKHRPK